MTDVSIKDQLKKMVELQKIDEEMYTYKRELKEKPAIVENLLKQFEAKKSALHDLEEKLKEIQVERKGHELELESREEEQKKLDSQLSQLKTNKEYQAKLYEIENIKANNSIIEDKILKLFDDAEAVNKEIDAEKEKLAEEEKKYLEEKQKVDELVVELTEKIKGFESQRDHLVPAIDPKFYSQYERVLEGRDGVAIVPVVSDACGGCHMNITSQTINELKRYDQIVNCEMCNRLLYIEDEL